MNHFDSSGMMNGEALSWCWQLNRIKQKGTHVFQKMAKGGKSKKPVKNTKKPKKLKAFEKSDRDPDSTLNTPDVEYRYGPGKWE